MADNTPKRHTVYTVHSRLTHHLKLLYYVFVCGKHVRCIAPNAPHQMYRFSLNMRKMNISHRLLHRIHNRSANTNRAHLSEAVNGMGFLVFSSSLSTKWFFFSFFEYAADSILIHVVLFLSIPFRSFRTYQQFKRRSTADAIRFFYPLSLWLQLLQWNYIRLHVLRHRQR